jgi:hypothetical protein
MMNLQLFITPLRLLSLSLSPLLPTTPLPLPPPPSDCPLSHTHTPTLHSWLSVVAMYLDPHTLHDLIGPPSTCIKLN